MPGQPNLTVRATDANTINLTWNIPADNGSAIIRFELEWSPDGSAGSWTRLPNPSATDTTYEPTRAPRGTTASARSTAQFEGSWSATAKRDYPTGGSRRAHAERDRQRPERTSRGTPPSYDGGADISSYEIHWSADGSANSYRRLTSPSASARSYTHSGLQPGDERYYQLRARNSAGWSEFSQPVSATTLPGVPDAPGADRACHRLRHHRADLDGAG